jgi:hypothetical protein
MQEKFVDTKEEIRCRKSKKDKQYNDLQNIAQKTKDRAIQFGLQNMIL